MRETGCAEGRHGASAVEEKVAAARLLCSRWGDGLRADSKTVQALHDLGNRAEAVAAHMTAMGLGAFCGLCASRQGGGCCSLFMAGETDPLQLLMNLLAGVDIRLLPHDDDSCTFLAGEGCQFLFKPMFCLNYLCHNIRHYADPCQLRQLERLTGLQLQQHYAVERHLQSWLRGNGAYGEGLLANRSR